MLDIEEVYDEMEKISKETKQEVVTLVCECGYEGEYDGTEIRPFCHKCGNALMNAYEQGVMDMLNTKRETNKKHKDEEVNRLLLDGVIVEVESGDYKDTIESIVVEKDGKRFKINIGVEKGWHGYEDCWMNLKELKGE